MAGEVVSAVVAYRKRLKELTGCLPGLADAKKVVDAWREQHPSYGDPNMVELATQEKQMLDKGWGSINGKINAIKSYRNRTGCGLKEAKDKVEAYMVGLHFPAANLNLYEFELLVGGKKGEAANAYGARTGCSLNQALHALAVNEEHAESMAVIRILTIEPARRINTPMPTTIPFCTSLLRAHRTLKGIGWRTMSAEERGEIDVESYSNGREQGYLLRVGGFSTGRALVLSQNRNSDSMVMYVGTSRDFANGGNVPSDAVYQESKHFSEKTDRKSERAAAKVATALLKEWAAGAVEEMANYVAKCAFIAAHP